MPRLFPSAPLCASLALAAVLTASAYAQVQPGPELYELRTTAAQTSGAQSNSAVPPGSGAGNTGFVSTNAPAKSAQQGAAKAKQAEPAAPASAPRLAARVREAVKNDAVTGATPRRIARRIFDEVDPYAQVGLRAGSFDVKPSLELSGGYDDNPLRLNKSRGSRFTLVTAKVETQSNWSRHELAGELRGAFTDYLQIPNNYRPERKRSCAGAST